MQRDSGYVSHSRPKSKHEGVRCRVLALENAHICSADRGWSSAHRAARRWGWAFIGNDPARLNEYGGFHLSTLRVVKRSLVAMPQAFINHD